MAKTTKEEKREKMLETLKAGVSSIATNQDWLNVLKLRRRLGGYSFRNIMLIFAQFPEATAVAGYRTWLKLGRQVKKGQGGIMIAAPSVRKAKSPDDEDRVFFRTTYVWDVSQTEGDALPACYTEPKEQLGGDEAASLLALCASDGFGIPVSTVEHLCAEGRLIFKTSEPREPRIELRSCLNEAHRASVLAHELGHALLHMGPDRDVHSVAFHEVEAESVAYLVTRELGLDLGESSFGYIASWASQEPQDALSSGARIFKAVDQILAACASLQEQAA